MMREAALSLILSIITPIPAAAFLMRFTSPRLYCRTTILHFTEVNAGRHESFAIVRRDDDYGFLRQRHSPAPPPAGRAFILPADSAA